jgi:hypothetical protein
MFDKHTILALFHVLFVSPLFLYVGLSREQTPEPVFYTLGGLGIFMGLYQIYKAYEKIMAGQSAWINFIHIFLVAPLMIILGYLGKSASRKYFEMLLLLGFAALGYHTLSIIRDIISR